MWCKSDERTHHYALCGAPVGVHIAQCRSLVALQITIRAEELEQMFSHVPEALST